MIRSLVLISARSFPRPAVRRASASHSGRRSGWRRPRRRWGRRVFRAQCQQCHPGGAAGLGPAINDKPLPAFLMRLQVRRGLGSMPEFDEHVISDTELNALVTYLQELRRQA